MISKNVVYKGFLDCLIGLDNPEEDLFFYHGDHLGSSAWISLAGGLAYQHLQYLPYGELFVEQRIGTWDVPYKYTGHERDNETGFDYAHARYYSSELSVFLSVDPLSDERASLSPYNYCSLNPVMRVDPTGMLDNEYGYTVDKNGKVEKVDNTGVDENGINQYDVIYNKADYDAGKRDYDKSGNKSGLKVDNTSIMSELSIIKQEQDYIDAEGTVTETSILRTSTTSNSSANEMLRLFKFFSDNTEVEWALYRTKSGYGLGTYQMSDKAPTYADFGFEYENVISMVHSHPGISPNMKQEKKSMGTIYRRPNGIKTVSGDWANVRRQHRKHGRQFYYYAYFPQSTRIWHVSKRGPVYIRTIGNSSRNFDFGTLK